MRPLIQRIKAFLTELKRRKVYRVVVLYSAVAYAVVGLADITLPVLGAPEGSLDLVLALAVAGLPVALLLGWTYDLTRGRLRRDPEDERIGRSRTRSIITTLAVLATSAVLGWASWTLWHLPSGAADGPVTADGDIPRGDPRHIAVLYLDDYSPDSDLGYLAAGLTESLIHELSNVPGLTVSSRNAVKPFRDRAVPWDSITSLLGVGSIVEGSVTRAGEDVRATVQLIDGPTGAHISSQVVEGSLEDLFALQDAVTDSVARALRRHLGREIRLRGARAGTSSQEAWTLFQRANDLLLTQEGNKYRLSREENLEVLARIDSLLVQARSEDADWIEPEVGRLEVAIRRAAVRGPRPGSLDTASARRAIQQANQVLAAHPDDPRALELRAWLRLRLAGTPAAGAYHALLDSVLVDTDRATRLNGDQAGAWWVRSEALIYKGRFAEAVQAANRALEADVFLDVEASAVHTLYYATLQLGPVDDAIRWCDEGHRRFPDNQNFIRCKLLILGTFPQVEPDVDRAWAWFRELLEASSDQERSAWRLFGGSHVAQTLARAGLADSARAVLRSIRGAETPPELGTHEAKVELLLGNEDEALRLIRLNLTVDPDTAYLARDWWFDGLHDNPEFRELVGLADENG
jgi:TolB-like protein